MELIAVIITLGIAVTGGFVCSITETEESGRTKRKEDNRQRFF